MKPISTLFPNNTEECRKAYLLGYHAGYSDGISGKEKDRVQAPSDPIEAMDLSGRAHSCLHYAGYRLISEVAALPEFDIQRMRNLGKKTANEIALALHKLGIFGTDWDLFLL